MYLMPNIIVLQKKHHDSLPLPAPVDTPEADRAHIHDVFIAESGKLVDGTFLPYH